MWVIVKAVVMDLAKWMTIVVLIMSLWKQVVEKACIAPLT
jgi:hypothetical protein